MKTAAALLIAGLALAPLAAEAQSYRCTGSDGKKYYGQSIPPQCLGLPVEQLNAQGMVIKRYDAQASAADRARKEAEEEERKKREAVTKEEGRRNRALLATYTSDKDIDDARRRALQDNEAAVKDIVRRIAGLKKSQDDLKKELDFYQGKNKPPVKLNNDIQNLDFDIQTQQGLLTSKKRDVDTINTRYDEDKKRYLELTKGGSK
jgi:predicted RNase H-like nuclease (RuvC/YqgF family)